MNAPATPPLRSRIEAGTLRSLLEAHRAAAGGRAEPCGLLLGGVSDGIVHVTEARVLPNVHAAPDRAFLLPAAGAVAAARDARERGMSVVGVWHGHLAGPARLSEADAAGLLSASRGPGEGRPTERPYVFLVSGGGDGRALVMRAFAMHSGRPREISLQSIRGAASVA